MTELTESQADGFNSLCSLVMKATGCSSYEATEKVICLMEEMLKSLNEGILAD